MRIRNKKWVNIFLKKENKFIINDHENLKDRWKEIFLNSNELNLEIGIGKGDFILNNAIKNININYIGIELVTTIFAIAARKIIDFNNEKNKINNIKIINFNAMKLEDIFNKNSLSKIFLNFSDPWPKAKHEKRRLTSEIFLNIYKKILKNNGDLFIKTDNNNLYNYSLEKLKKHKWKIIRNTNNLYKENDLLTKNIATEYEIKFHKLNKNINYIHAKIIK